MTLDDPLAVLTLAELYISGIDPDWPVSSASMTVGMKPSHPTSIHS